MQADAFGLCSRGVPASSRIHSLLTPLDHPSVFPYCQVLGLKKGLPQTHFFRNCEDASSRAVSAPRKANEPRNISVTVTSFILWRRSDTLERSKEPSVSNQASCTVLVRHEGRWWGVRGGVGGALLGPVAYLPLALRGAGGFCTGRVGDKQGKGSPCTVPGFQRFPSQLPESWSNEERSQESSNWVPELDLGHEVYSTVDSPKFVPLVQRYKFLAVRKAIPLSTRWSVSLPAEGVIFPALEGESPRRPSDSGKTPKSEIDCDEKQEQ